MRPVIIVILLTVNSQIGIDSITNEEATECMSYRYVPCHKSVNKTTFLEDDKTWKTKQLLSNESVSLCISYRHIPCRKGWPSYTIIFEDEEERLRRENSLFVEKIEICEKQIDNCTSEMETANYQKQLLINQVKLCGNLKEDLAQKLNSSEQTQKFLIRKLNLMETKRNLTTEPDPLSKILNYERKMLYSYIAPSLLNKPYPGVDRFIRYEVARTGTLPLMDTARLVPEYGQVLNDVTSFNYPLTILPCEVDPNKRSVFIAVNSIAEYVNERIEIRKTWPRILKTVQDMGLLGTVRYGFFIGLPETNATQAQIEKESETYGDLIQVDISDSYIDPMKMAGLLNWLNNNCANVDFVFKVNDYMFVDVRNIAQFVRSNYKSVKTLYGDQSPLLQPPRSGRWAQPESAWPWNSYPRHVFRHAFFMHGTSIFPLLAAFQTTPTIPLYYVYLTGMLTEKAKVTIKFCNGSSSSTNASIPLSGMAFRLGIAPTCKQTYQIAWTTHNSTDVHGDKMIAHKEVEEYYKNFYQCNMTDSTGTVRKIDPNDPIKFPFD